MSTARAAHRTKFSASTMFVTNSYSTTKKRRRQWYKHSVLITTTSFQQPTNQPTRRLNTIPLSSRRRAVVKFLIECSLFVNQRVHYSITGMTKYYISSASATMLGTRRHANGFNRLSSLFYDNRGTFGAGDIVGGGRAGRIGPGNQIGVRTNATIAPETITTTPTRASLKQIAITVADGNHTVACDRIIRERTTTATKLHDFEDHGRTGHCFVENAHPLHVACSAASPDATSDRRKAMKLSVFVLKNHSSVLLLMLVCPCFYLQRRDRTRTHSY
jgi:hypothetical protein